MKSGRLLWLSLSLVAPGWFTPAPVDAQTPAVRLIAAARAQLDELNSDSAATLLRQVLDARVQATSPERIAAFFLMGVTELVAGREPRAREYFRQGLAIDPAADVDTLRDLHSDLLRVFAAEKERLLRLAVRAPLDTLVPAQDGALGFTVRTSRLATVAYQVTGPAGMVVHRDSLTLSGMRALTWNLRASDGATLPPGTYGLRVTSRDSAGTIARPVEIVVTVERERVDTTPLPPRLAPGAFLPESATVKQRQAGALLRGLGFGALAFGLSNGQERGDTRGYLVVGALVAGGVAGFFNGKAVTRALPENIRRNQELKDQDARNRAAIAAANQRAREQARVRVRTEPAP